MTQIRKKVSEFRANNNIDTLLTLRTKDELGHYTKDYAKAMQSVSKIPTNYLDHQFKHPITYNYPVERLVLSYHGS